MFLFPVIVLAALLCQAVLYDAKCTNSTFPANFKFGAGSAAHEIEGAWDKDGKSRSFWDWLIPAYHLSHDLRAAEFYYNYREDVALMKKVGLQYFRFSLSWTRIIPEGFSNEINPAGVDFYNNLIEELHAAGIEPLVTIYHWDTPLSLTHLGGWANPLMVDYFVDFADLVFRLFGDRVKLWATINEPRSVCQLIPDLLQSVFFAEMPIATSDYICGHHVLMAHAKVYRLYHEKYQKFQRGRVGIILNYDANLPLSNSSADLLAVKRANAFDLDWFAYPLTFGDYPLLMKQIIANNSASQNYSTSRLPEFTPEQKVALKGAYDVFLLNSYSASLVTLAAYNETPSYQNDKQIESSLSLNWTLTNAGFAVYPPGLRVALKYVQDTYNPSEVIITENGYSNTGILTDTDRIQFIEDYLNQVLLSICEDGVNVTHYTYWSFLDSFGYNGGYDTKYGLVDVNRNSSQLARTLRKSAYWYKKLISSRLIL